MDVGGGEIFPGAGEVAAHLAFVSEAGDDATDSGHCQKIVQRHRGKIFGLGAEALLELLKLGFEFQQLIGFEPLAAAAVIAGFELRGFGGIEFVEEQALGQR